MKKRLFLLISILAISCNKDEVDVQTDKSSINLVTGVNFRQDTNDKGLKLGNPNVLVNNKFLLYPNPANESVYILAEENVTDVWFVSANAEKIHQDVNFSNVLNTNLYSEPSINSNSKFSLSGQSSNSFKMSIGTLAKGYYKVFVKIGGKIYWDNLYKYENQGNNEEQFSKINVFWK
ncbi:hypothetical protein [Flavobacterium aquicola]|uniref:Uncharacterized protein n=1 Tax=Flavobacterium aquicola TaxID=1682742 RepID=A0A3E0EMD7_9FLAO|nr:hypothetical protein [Flavobacterium aquicola]REG98873.1 hypothetical protein C8P67_10532 [Flavobacterium aquicola]